VEILIEDADWHDDWEEFIESCERMQAQHDSGNCPDECIYCDENGCTVTNLP
jgi:hypothetical protein